MIPESDRFHAEKYLGGARNTRLTQGREHEAYVRAERRPESRYRALNEGNLLLNSRRGLCYKASRHEPAGRGIGPLNRVSPRCRAEDQEGPSRT
jgi:hypothetical protein